VGAAALGQVLDQDELIREERANLQRLQQNWGRHASQGRKSSSRLERAKLARDRNEIEEKLRAFQEQKAPAGDRRPGQSEPRPLAGPAGAEKSGILSGLGAACHAAVEAGLAGGACQHVANPRRESEPSVAGRGLEAALLFAGKPKVYALAEQFGRRLTGTSACFFHGTILRGKRSPTSRLTRYLSCVQYGGSGQRPPDRAGGDEGRLTPARRIA